MIEGYKKFNTSGKQISCFYDNDLTVLHNKKSMLKNYLNMRKVQHPHLETKKFLQCRKEIRKRDYFQACG